MASKNEVLELFRDNPGWTSRQIADELGCHSAYVRATLQRNGLALAIQKRRKTRRALPFITADEPCEPRFVPLVDLSPGECKWPVNDAALGELHLFCGAKAVGSYCSHHFLRSIGAGTESERSAHRVLEAA